MAHYAFINEHNVVVEVIVGNDETQGDWESYYGNLKGLTCLRTSYNGNIRKQFAGIDYTYDPDADVFIEPQPFPSWQLDPASFTWVAPKSKPQDGQPYEWDEDGQTWVVVEELT